MSIGGRKKLTLVSDPVTSFQLYGAIQLSRNIYPHNISGSLRYIK